MSVDLTFEMQAEYLYVQVSGPFDLDESIETFIKILDMAGQHGAVKVLINGMGIKGTPNTADYYYLGENIAKEMRNAVISGRTKNLRIAFVALPPYLDKGHFVEVVATNRGANVWSFDNLEDARSWLRKGSGADRRPM